MQPEDNLIAKQINSTFEHSLIQKVNIFSFNLIAKQINSTFENSLIQKVNIFSFNSAKFCNYI